MKISKKIRIEAMLEAAKNIDTDLYGRVAISGIDITGWLDNRLLTKWDIEDIEEIIYNENITKEKIEAAEKACKKIKCYLKKEISQLEYKMEKSYELARLAVYCVDEDILSYSKGLEAAQYMTQNAEEWGLLYLWYNYIFLQAASRLEEYEKENI